MPNLNDLFNRTGGLNGSNASPLGGVWQNQPSVWVEPTAGEVGLDGSKVTMRTSDPSLHTNSVSTASADQKVTLQFTPTGDNWQVIALLRANATTGAAYQLLFGPGVGGIGVYRRSSTTESWGGAAQIGSSVNNPMTVSERGSHALTFSVIGNAFSATIDGSPIALGTITDNTITTAGRAGFGGRSFTSDSISEDDEVGGGTPVAFTGTVPTINATVGSAGSVDLASYFSGSLTPFTYTTHAGTLPTGFSRSGSVISWTTGTTAGTTTGIQVRATDTGSNVATTNAFDIVVAPAAPTVNTHPSNQTVTTPTAATFTVSASGTGLTYQWQRNPGGNTSFANIGGATSASYTTGATAVTGGSHNNGDTYRCVVSNAGGSVNSNAATLTVNAATGTLTLTTPLCNNTGLISGTWISATGVRLSVVNESTGASVLVVTGRATDASGVLTAPITDAAIVTGQTYRILPSWSGNAGLSQVLTAT